MPRPPGQPSTPPSEPSLTSTHHPSPNQLPPGPALTPPPAHPPVGSGASAALSQPVSNGHGDAKGSAGEVEGSEWEAYARSRKRKWAALGFNDNHMDDLEATALSYHLAMVQDQTDVLYPPPPTAFRSTTDAIERLLPYHIYQMHDSELEGQPLPAEKRAAKEKAETREAQGLHDKIQSINERFFKLRRREGTHPSPLPSLIDLLRSSTQSVRQELAVVQAKYKQVQQVHEQMEAERVAREKREAQKDAANAAFAARVRAQHASPAAGPSTPGTAASSSTPGRSANGPPPSTPVGGPSTPRPTGSPMPVRPPPATPSAFVARPSPGPPTPSAALNGTPGPRPRGRPPKVRTDGLRETVLKGGPPTQSAPTMTAQRPPTTPSTSALTPSTPRPANPQTPGQPSTPANASADKKGPVAMSLPTKILPQFVSLGILNHPPDPSRPTPGTLLRTTPDKKHVVVSVDLSKCSPIQLNGLAKVLGVTAKQTGADGKGAGPAGTSAPAPKQ